MTRRDESPVLKTESKRRFCIAKSTNSPTSLARLLQTGARDRRRPGSRDRSGASIDHVVIAARGTSDNAARYAQYLLGAANGLVVGLATPSLFTIYKQPPRFGNALVMGISQSGKSPDIVSVVAEGQRQGALTAAITNVPDSDLGRTADYVIDLHAGEEQSDRRHQDLHRRAGGHCPAERRPERRCRAQGDAGPDAPGRWPRPWPSAEPRSRRWPSGIATCSHCVVIGRGYNYATAFELALKLKELTYTIVEPYSSADFMHGPLAMVAPGFPVIVIAPSGLMLAGHEGLYATPLKRAQAPNWW